MKHTRESLSHVLDAIGEKVARAAMEALSKGADLIVDDAKERCPVDTGQLRESIHNKIQRKGTRAKIVADAKKDGIYYGKIVEFSPKINRPFMYPALDANRDTVRDMISDAVRKGLRK